MSQAIHDSNQVPGLLGTSNANGTTPIRLRANPTTHALIASDGVSGSDLSGDIAARDENGEPVMLAVSNDNEITPVAPYADSVTGALLIKST